MIEFVSGKTLGGETGVWGFYEGMCSFYRVLVMLRKTSAASGVRIDPRASAHIAVSTAIIASAIQP